MKRLASSDSLGALISMCPTSGERSPTSNNMYSREYQSILDGFDKDGYIEESGHMHIPGKKRRLSVDQVKALEKNFEVENKLEPERKVKLAQELGLQPRQVAVWFQNRRARWKTKLLERDYDLLKANFDNLKHNYESLRQDKDSLVNKIRVLKSKLNENSENNICVKEEALMPDSDSDNNIKVVEPIASPASLRGGCDDDAMLLIQKSASDYKDGASDSNSSSILNEDNNNSPYASNSSCGGGFLQNEQQLVSMSPNSPSLRFNNRSSSPSSINCFSFNERRSEGLGSCENQNNNNAYHPELVKLEEQNFLSGEEACNFFSDEAPPTLHWDSPHHWN